MPRAKKKKEPSAHEARILALAEMLEIAGGSLLQCAKKAREAGRMTNGEAASSSAAVGAAPEPADAAPSGKKKRGRPKKGEVSDSTETPPRPPSPTATHPPLVAGVR